MSFFFTQHWKVWGRRDVAVEAAILYDPFKLDVVETIAAEVDEAWRHRVCVVTYPLGTRTVALQGTILRTNRDIIIISFHMFASRSGYSTDKRLAMTNAIIVTAQEFANERNTTVILCGDWNGPVNMIQLTTGAFMADPSENDGIDSLIIINPVCDKPYSPRDYADQYYEDILRNLNLYDVKFFRWTDNVTADDMGGLKPEDIDAIYCWGGKHRPIVANFF